MSVAAVSAVAVPEITPPAKVNPVGKSPASVYVNVSFASTSENAVATLTLKASPTTAV